MGHGYHGASLCSSIEVHVLDITMKVLFPCPYTLRKPNNIFIQSGNFHSASSSPLLLRGAPNTARIRCRSFTPKRHSQLQVKDLPKVPTWRLERDSNL